MKLTSRWHDFVVIEKVVPLGNHQEPDGHWVADLELTVRRRWWFFLHPMYWYGFFGAPRFPWRKR